LVRGIGIFEESLIVVKKSQGPLLLAEYPEKQVVYYGEGTYYVIELQFAPSMLRLQLTCSSLLPRVLLWYLSRPQSLKHAA